MDFSFRTKKARDPSKPPPERPWWASQQVTRLAVLFALVIAGLFTARHYLIPPSFGQTGHYRAAALEGIMARPVKYVGRDACAECHTDVFDVHTKARHQTVACETCHGPGAMHIADPGQAKPVVPAQRNFCIRCHAYDSSRPTGFPQIDPIAHNPPDACVKCHSPHEPEPPVLPTTCGACHAEIDRTKVASPHAALPCVRCHETKDQHRDTPRLSLPGKPANREFCGECHASGAKAPREIPRVDIAAHGGRYLCWQCHYPHFPEAR